MLDFLLPETDAGVALQFSVWFVASAAGLFFTRSNRDVRLLVIGLSILTLGVMLVRAVH